MGVETIFRRGDELSSKTDTAKMGLIEDSLKGAGVVSGIEGVELSSDQLERICRPFVIPPQVKNAGRVDFTSFREAMFSRGMKSGNASDDDARTPEPAPLLPVPPSRVGTFRDATFGSKALKCRLGNPVESMRLSRGQRAQLEERIAELTEHVRSQKEEIHRQQHELERVAEEASWVSYKKAMLKAQHRNAAAEAYKTAVRTYGV